MDISYFSSIFLSIGTTGTTLAMSENLHEARLLLALIENLMLTWQVSYVFYPYQMSFWC